MGSLENTQVSEAKTLLLSLSTESRVALLHEIYGERAATHALADSELAALKKDTQVLGIALQADRSQTKSIYKAAAARIAAANKKYEDDLARIQADRDTEIAAASSTVQAHMASVAAKSCRLLELKKAIIANTGIQSSVSAEESLEFIFKSLTFDGAEPPASNSEHDQADSGTDSDGQTTNEAVGDTDRAEETNDPDAAPNEQPLAAKDTAESSIDDHQANAAAPGNCDKATIEPAGSRRGSSSSSSDPHNQAPAVFQPSQPTTDAAAISVRTPITKSPRLGHGKERYPRVDRDQQKPPRTVSAPHRCHDRLSSRKIAYPKRRGEPLANTTAEKAPEFKFRPLAKSKSAA